MQNEITNYFSIALISLFVSVVSVIRAEYFSALITFSLSIIFFLMEVKFTGADVTGTYIFPEDEFKTNN